MRSLLTLLRETRKTRAARLATDRLDAAARAVAAHRGEHARLTDLLSHYRALIATCQHDRDGNWHRYADLQDARVAIEEQLQRNAADLNSALNCLSECSN